MQECTYKYAPYAHLKACKCIYMDKNVSVHTPVYLKTNSAIHIEPASKKSK